MFHASALLSPYFSQITFFIEEDRTPKNKKIVIHEEDFDRKIRLFIHFQNYTLSFILICFRLIKAHISLNEIKPIVIACKYARKYI